MVVVVVFAYSPLFSFDNNNITAHVPSNYMNSTPLFFYALCHCGVTATAVVVAERYFSFCRVTNARSTQNTLSTHRFANIKTII